MNKNWAILLTCALWGGCFAHETNLQAAQDERDALLLNKRMKEGCQFVRDQDAYRECLLNTYYSQYPKGYRTAELTDGEAIAIVSDSKASYGSYQGQRMVSQVAPLPSSGPQIVPYATSEVTTVDSTYTQEYVAPQATVVKTQEIVAQVPLPTPQPEPVVQPVVIPQPVATPAPQQDPSWWNNYQQTRVITPAPTVKCPCEDPNDPCPQCYEK